MKTNTVQQLKRRGYSVTETPGGMLIEKGSFWGQLQYDSSINADTSHFYWPRSLLLGLISYGMITLATGLWWMHQKGRMKAEILALTQGS